MQLSKLREDLILLPDSQLGEKDSWLIKDPVHGEFFTLSGRTKNILAVWNSASNSEALIKDLKIKGIDVDLSEIASLSEFLDANCLTAKFSSGALSKKVSGFWKTLIERYFFFKLDLLTPGPSARKLANWLSDMPVQVVEKIGWVVGCISLGLTVQASYEFLLQAKGMFTYAGAIAIFMAIVFSKFIHEGAHALVALAHGVRVRSVGAAFILLYPIMYTEVTDSWGLRNKFHRFRISSAGVRAELFLGCISLLIWNLSDRGLVNSVAFYLAVVSLASSFLINLNPFMRFDGYHMLSDVTNIKNLHGKSSKLALWRLRHWILGVDYHYSNVISSRYVGLLTTFGFVTYFYRLLVFFGLALLAYHMLFKLLGIVIFVLEVVWLIAIPIVREISYWRHLRVRMRLRKTNSVLGLLGVVGALFLVSPITGHTRIPAVFFPNNINIVTNSEAGFVAELPNRSSFLVKPGDTVLYLDLEKIRKSVARAEIETEIAKLEAIHWKNNPDASRQTLENSWELRRNNLESLQSRLSSERVTSSTEGWYIPNLQLHRGDFLPSGSEVGVVIPADTDSYSVVGFLPKNEEQNLSRFGSARFYFNAPERGQHTSLECTNLTVNMEHGFAIPYRELTLSFGGEIRQSAFEAKTQDFLIEFRCVITERFEGPSAPIRGVGTILIETTARPLLAKWILDGLDILRNELAF